MRMRGCDQRGFQQQVKFVESSPHFVRKSSYMLMNSASRLRHLSFDTESTTEEKNI